MAAADSSPVMLGRASSKSSASSLRKLGEQPKQLRSASLRAPRPDWLPTEGPGQRSVAPDWWALRLSQLIDFVKACRETEAWSVVLSRRGSVSVADVNRHFVVPWTKGLGNSVSLLMNGSAPLRSELMISHTWGEDADELLEALELYSTQHDVPLSAAAFFCTLSLYQPCDQAPGALSIAEQIGLAPFKRVIEAHPALGMMVVHTTAQDVYARMWCVHEVDEALEANIEVRGAMSRRFRAKFIGQASVELLDLRTDKAKCSDPADEAMLREAISKKPGSFQRLDEVILAFRRNMFKAEEAALTERMAGAQQGGELLLRAVPGNRLLRFGAWMLWHMESREIYEESQPAVEIDYFVSHSQQTSWKSKGWALLFTAAVLPAVLLGCLCQVAVLALDYQMQRSEGRMNSYSWLFFKMSFLSNASADPTPVYFTLNFVISCVAIVAMMLAAPHLPGLARSRFFIDSCCVAKDSESQLQALRQARLVMMSSRKMILLWNVDYFDSLKCVHELATFLHVHQGYNHVQVVPVCIPILTAALFFFHLFATIALVILAPTTIGSFEHQLWIAEHVPAEWRYLFLVTCFFWLCFIGLYLPPSFVFWKFAELYMGHRKRLQEQLCSFSVEKSRCFLEAHRAALLEDIGEQFGSAAAFERFIQQDLAQQIPMLRQAPVPLTTALVAAIAHLFCCTMGMLNAVHADNTEVAWHAAVSLPLIWVCVDSIALNLVMALAGRGLGEDGDPSSSLRRRLLGPLAAAVVFACLQALSLATVFPVLPLWGVLAILVAMTAVVAVLYNYGFGARQRAGSRGSHRFAMQKPRGCLPARS